MRHRRAHQPERRAQVDVQQLVPGRVGRLLDGPRREDARGIHERGQPAERPDGFRDNGIWRVRGGHVGLEGRAPAARAFDLLSYLLQGRRLTADGQNGGALTSEANGGRPSDPAGGARHHDNLHGVGCSTT